MPAQPQPQDQMSTRAPTPLQCIALLLCGVTDTRRLCICACLRRLVNRTASRLPRRCNALLCVCTVLYVHACMCASLLRGRCLRPARWERRSAEDER